MTDAANPYKSPVDDTMDQRPYQLLQKICTLMQLSIMRHDEACTRLDQFKDDWYRTLTEVKVLNKQLSLVDTKLTTILNTYFKGVSADGAEKKQTKKPTNKRGKKK